MALPVSPDPTDRRAAVLRMLGASPDGLSDAALARELGDGVRPQTVNQLCRRLVAEGALERVGTRPILNRLPAPPVRRRRRTATPAVASVPSPPDASESPVPAVNETPEAPGTPPSSTTTRRRRQGRTDVAEVVTPAEPEIESERPTCVPPPYDALQAWSRVVNVQALVAQWLVGRGATLRSATLEGQGPTRDLVASLDGDDLHVEVTGWPADGARTHPTTIAGDWFSGAEQAATRRRRAHPQARIVIALPDTRRYRSLTEQRATSLAGAQAEVWFVDRAGSVHAR